MIYIYKPGKELIAFIFKKKKKFKKYYYQKSIFSLDTLEENTNINSLPFLEQSSRFHKI